LGDGLLSLLWDFIVILNVLIWVLALYVQGYISRELAILALLLTTIVLALGRGIGGHTVSLVHFLFRVGLTIASLATFLIIFSGGRFTELGTLTGHVLTLFIILIGLYIMFYPILRKKR
jgi:hypothetical protein